MTKWVLRVAVCVCTVLFPVPNSCTSSFSPTSCLYCDNAEVICSSSITDCQVNTSIIDCLVNSSIIDCQANSSACYPKNCSSETEVCMGFVSFSRLEDGPISLFSHCGGAFKSSSCNGINNACIFSTLAINPTGPRHIESDCCCNKDDCVVTNFTVPVVIKDDPVTSSPPAVSNPTTGVGPSSGGALLISLVVIVPLMVVVVGLALGLAFIFVFKKNMISRCCIQHERHREGQGRAGDVSSSYAPQPWTLQGLVGQGRFGHVYKAVYGDQLVAVKVYSQHCLRWWENESHISSLDSTRHKNILEYHADAMAESHAIAGTSPLQLYLVTRYYPLGSLEGYLRAHVVNWIQACHMVRSMTSGLRHLHAGFYINESDIRMDKYPIAHRDLKSSNILVKSEDGECVIADLGLALELKPTDDPKEIANYGQVGTVRYMSPEALEARINLYDTQSFKQIDMYALGLVMWEIMSRCCVFTVEELAPYQLPYGDLVPRATLELMKEVVCVQEYRPSIPAMWTDHMPLSLYAEMVRGCLDRDPEARPTAGNLSYHMTNLLSYSMQDLQQHSNNTSMQNHTPNHTPLGRSPSYISSSIHPGLIQENSQSSPPPCYSPTDPIPIPSRMGLRWDRNHILSSMPHIVQGEVGSEMDQNPPPHQSSRSLLSTVSAYPLSSAGEGGAMGLGSQHLLLSSHPLPHSSVQNTSELRGNYDSLPDDDSSIDSGSSSPVGSHGDGQGVPGLEPECHVPNSDSGIQTHSLSLNHLSRGSLCMLALTPDATNHLPHPSQDGQSNTAQTSF